MKEKEIHNSNVLTEHQQLTAAWRYGGGRANINSCAINKHCAYRQFSVSNPPQRQAAKRCVPFYRPTASGQNYSLTNNIDRYK